MPARQAIDPQPRAAQLLMNAHVARIERDERHAHHRAGRRRPADRADRHRRRIRRADGDVRAIRGVYRSVCRRRRPRHARTRVTFFADFAGGFSYIRSDQLVLGLLLLGTIPMIFAMPYQTLMPVFASKDVWHVGSGGLGVLQAMSGVGGLAGTLVTANLDRSPRKGRVMLVAALRHGRLPRRVQLLVVRRRAPHARDGRPDIDGVHDREQHRHHVDHAGRCARTRDAASR